MSLENQNDMDETNNTDTIDQSGNEGGNHNGTTDQNETERTFQDPGVEFNDISAPKGPEASGGEFVFIVINSV